MTEVHSFTYWGTSWLFPSFWKLWINLLSTAMHRLLCGFKFSVHLGWYQGAQLLDLMVRVCLVLLETQLSPKAAIPFCIATSSEWEFQFLHNFTSTCVAKCFTLWPFWWLYHIISLLIHNSPMTYDVQLLFICLFPPTYLL